MVAWKSKMSVMIVKNYNNESINENRKMIILCKN